MNIVQNRPPVQVALVVRPPLAGVVALALAHIRAVPREMPISEVGQAGCDFAVLDEAAADGGLRVAIAEMVKSNKPVLVLVRNHGMQGALNAIGLGATEILRVPFDPAELVIRASQAIHRATGRLPELDGGVKIGKLHVDIGSGHIALDGSAPHLTPLERGLLYVLIANAGRVVSREDIIDSVWGTDAEPNSNLVDRHIRDLRRKLQDDWRRPNVLATMRGQGYMVPITD
ncbi:MAG TPA: response regulator transcription factor [Candidatus Limnocylindria bacterium]|jgi:DNA-binding response OmpR family regulator|nr:response regulator transcription factor [Candidatus Limnocylindria bacterium]